MSEIFTSQTLGSSHQFDMVVLHLGTHRPQIPYQKAFEILGGIRMAAKMAMQTDGNQVEAWRRFAHIDADPTTPIPSRTSQRSTEVSNVRNYAVRFEGSLVVLVLDGLELKMHYADALTWYTGVRLAARQAKAWAGDTGKVLRGAAYLADAEDNRRQGIG